MFSSQTILKFTQVFALIASSILPAISRGIEINMTSLGRTTYMEGSNTIVEVNPSELVTFTTTIQPEADENVNSIGYTLNFSNSDHSVGELVLNNWVNNNNSFPLVIDTLLDSTAGNNTVSAGTFGVGIPPATDAGTFQLTAPTTPGDYLLTVHRVSVPVTFNDSQVVDSLGQPLSVSDYGDVTVRVTGSFPWESSWNVDATGDWFVDDNWTGTSPIVSEAMAIFGSTITTPRTIVADLPLTVKQITFDNINSYIVAGAGNLNILPGTSSETVATGIATLQGNHEFQLPVNLLQDTIVDVASGANLVFNNVLNLMGNTLTKTGNGIIAIQNDLVFDGGVVHMQQGIVSGNGTIGGNVYNSGGIISPGQNSVATSFASMHSASHNVTAVPEPIGCELWILGSLLAMHTLGRKQY